MRFQKWVVVVTGSGRGIGKATADAFTAEGATVIGAELDSPEPVDATDEAQVQALFERIKQQHGRLDTLVCNAGRPWSSTTLSATDTDWQSCIDLNLKSAWLCAKAAHPLLSESDRASIVTVASAQGQRSNKSSFPYTAAK